MVNAVLCSERDVTRQIDDSVKRGMLFASLSVGKINPATSVVIGKSDYEKRMMLPGTARPILSTRPRSFAGIGDTGPMRRKVSCGH